MDSHSFPNSCLRGIRKSDWLTDDGKVLGIAFEPNFKPKEDQRRTDGYWDASINWEDSNEVVAITRNDKSGNGQYGVIRVQREGLDYSKTQLGVDDSGRHMFDYERAPLRGNPYHGNILFLESLGRQHARMVAGAIAAFYASILNT